MGSRDIGSIGENASLSWCGLEGFHAQKSQADRLGWDFLLEREAEVAPDRPLDAQGGSPKFLVQVKSTEASVAAPRIKLSALKHLVDADLPAAVVVLSYEGGGRHPARAALVRVDDELVAATLRRVRKEEARGNRAINRTTVPVPLARAVPLGTSGEGLATTLMGMVGGGMSEYVAAKAAHRRTCGFEDGVVFGSFHVPGKDAAARIGGLFLGGPRRLEVCDVEIERRRFGIALANDRERLREAVLEVDAPPLSSATLELAAAGGGRVLLDVDLFVAPPLGRGGRGPVRLANGFVELVLDFEAGRAEFSFDPTGSRSVDVEEAISLVETGAILARRHKSLTVDLGGTRLDMPLDREEGPFRRWVPAAAMLRRVLAAIVRSGRRLAPRTVELPGFVAWAHAHAEFLAVPSMSGANMVFPRWSDERILDDQDVVLAPFTLGFGGFRYTALVEIPIVRVRRTKARVTIVGGEPRIVAEEVGALGSDTSDFLEEAVERSKRDRDATGAALVADGFEGWETVALSLA